MGHEIKRPAVFLDRDGVLIEEKQYLCRVEDVEVLPGVYEGLKLLRDAGFALVIVTNQAGVARGYFSEEAVAAVHDHLKKIFAEQSIAFDGIYYCPCHPDGVIPEYTCSSPMRKPEPGMLLTAAGELDLALGKSFLVGDKVSDLEAAERAGAMPLLVQTGYGRDAAGQRPDVFCATDFLAAATEILKESDAIR